eukprot:Nk52_evm27s211 gene=Nk52_evmTU27s211
MAYIIDKGPKLDADLSSVLPYETTLRDGSPVILLRITVPSQQEGPEEKRGKQDILNKMHTMLNGAIQEGNAYPQEFEVDYQGFLDYYLCNDAFVLLRRREKSVPGGGVVAEENMCQYRAEDVVGCFYIKPNFPGRCSHICNGGFLVEPGCRRQGAGMIITKCFTLLAPALGYRASFFNLVFENNPGSYTLWEKNGFQMVGIVPQALRDKTGKYVDARQYYKSYVDDASPGE